MIISNDVVHPLLHDQLVSSIPQLLSAVVGGCIVFVASWATNKVSIQRSREQFDSERRQTKDSDRRNKGEELYVLIQYWMNGLTANYMNFNSVMQGKLTYDQALDLGIEAGNKLAEKFNPARMELLLDAYFPSCRSSYDEMLALRDELNKVHTQFKWSYERGENRGHELLPMYVAIQKRMEKKIAVLQGELLKEIRKIGGVDM